MRAERVPYSAEAHKALAAANPPADLAHEIVRGEVALWRIDGGRAWVATEARGDDLWIHALAGRQIGGDVVRAIFRSAERRGFHAVRAITRRKGIARMLRRFNVCAIPAGPEIRLMRLWHVVQ